MSLFQNLLLKLHGKRICVQCKKVLYTYDFYKDYVTCRKCTRINVNKKKREESKYLDQCIYCKSIKFDKWDDGFKAMLTCRRCGNVSFATHPDIKRVLKRRFRNYRTH